MTLDKMIKPIVMFNIVDTYFFSNYQFQNFLFDVPQHS